MTPEDRAARVMERWHRQVVDTTTPFSGDEVLARDIAEAIREAVVEAREACAKIADGMVIPQPPGSVDAMAIWTNNTAVDIAAAIRAQK